MNGIRPGVPVAGALGLDLWFHYPFGGWGPA